MRAAEWSQKSAVENQQDVSAMEIRKTDWLIVEVGQFEIGCGCIKSNFEHLSF